MGRTSHADVIRPRRGLAIDRQRLGPAFWQDAKSLVRLHQEIMDGRKSDTEVQSRIISHVWERANLGKEVRGLNYETEYQRYTACIAGALKSHDTYAHTMLVEDILQPITVPNEWAGVADPMTLLDGLRTVREERTRFELRRALHFGASFYEYEKHFGTEQELYERLHEFELFMHAVVLNSDKQVDARLIHRIRDTEAGQVFPSGIRLPQFDGSSADVQLGENQVYLSFREVSALDHPLYVVEKERPKSRWSGVLKAIRKEDSISNLHDVLGMTFYVNHQQNGNELNQFIDLLEKRLPKIDDELGTTHRLRGGSGHNQQNIYSAADYGMETIFIHWDANLMLQHRSAIDKTWGNFNQAERLRKNFWNRVKEHGEQEFIIEVQIGTLRDMVAATLSGSDENHAIYKARQAGNFIEGDARNILEMLYPKKYYNIDWNSPIMEKLLREKQLASIGLHPKVLQQYLEQTNKNGNDNGGNGNGSNGH